jgi:hypothetical protein
MIASFREHSGIENKEHAEIEELMKNMIQYFGENILPNPTQYPLSFSYYLRMYLICNADVIQKGE